MAPNQKLIFNLLSRAGFGEEGGERVILGLGVLGLGAVGGNAVFHAEPGLNWSKSESKNRKITAARANASAQGAVIIYLQFPAFTTGLDTSLTNVEGDDFSHFVVTLKLLNKKEYKVFLVRRNRSVLFKATGE